MAVQCVVEPDAGRPGSAQSSPFHGRVTGTVLDSSGGAVEGAQVVLSAADIGLERSVKTDSSGGFHFQELPLATFKLTVTKSGFKSSVQTNIITKLNQVNEINVTLVPGTVEVRVEVSAAAPMLETQTNTVGRPPVSAQSEIGFLKQYTIPPEPE
jgi:hypothetical protein